MKTTRSFKLVTTLLILFLAWILLAWFAADHLNVEQPVYIDIPPRNILVNSFGKIGFLDLQTDNYEIAQKSRYRGKGVDIDALKAEIKKAQ